MPKSDDLIEDQEELQDRIGLKEGEIVELEEDWKEKKENTEPDEDTPTKPPIDTQNNSSALLTIFQITSILSALASLILSGLVITGVVPWFASVISFVVFSTSLIGWRIARASSANYSSLLNAKSGAKKNHQYKSSSKDILSEVDASPVKEKETKMPNEKNQEYIKNKQIRLAPGLFNSKIKA